MDRRVIVRYSSSFKREVVSQLESGRFSSIREAMAHYGITGRATVKRWLGQHGRNALCPKVVRVEKPNEKDEIVELKKQIRQLKEALGQTQAEKLIGEAYLEIACEEMGLDIEAFKKNADGPRFIRAKKDRR